MVGASLLAAACAMPTPPPAIGAGSSKAACGDATALRHALVARINAARAEARMCGGARMDAAPPLEWSRVLARIARAHALDMARNDFVAHAGSDGRGVDARADRAGYPWETLGENVGAGAPDAARAVTHWLGSPGHCRNLMNVDYREIGAACANAADSRYGHYWDIVLGTRR